MYYRSNSVNQIAKEVFEPCFRLWSFLGWVARVRRSAIGIVVLVFSVAAGFAAKETNVDFLLGIFLIVDMRHRKKIYI